MPRGIFFLLAAACLALAGCARGPGGGTFENAPIVLISIDTLRSDRLPAYGYGKVETPAIDALAKDSILFERAYSHYPITLPSHTSILSGLLPPRHGVRDNAGYVFDAAQHPYLPRVLKDAGYDTAGFVSGYVLRGSTGLAAGFDVYDDRLEPEAGQSMDAVQRPGPETARLAMEWVRARADRPFFLFLHLYEPHAPYLPPEPFASRYENPYDGEVAAADAVVGDVLGELRRRGLYDRAVVVLLSDHGEGLGDHGEQFHGVLLYREALQVPLLVKLPGSRQGGRRVAAPARLVDLVPTLLGLTGREPLAGLDGASLLELLQPEAASRKVYSETFYSRLHYGWSDLASVIDGRFHYIEGPDPELYDLAADPAERENVLTRERRAYAALRQEAARHDRKLAPPTAVDQETTQQLMALGYLSGSSVVAEGDLPDPKSQRAAMQGIERGLHEFGIGEYEKAVPIFRRLLVDNPRMMDVWSYLGFSLHRLGRHEEALAAYEKALELSGGSPNLALSAASSLLLLGRLDRAEAHARLALKGHKPAAYELLLKIAQARGDTAAVRTLYERAAAEGAESQRLKRQYAMSLTASGRPGEAVQLLAPLVAGTGGSDGAETAETAETPTLNVLALALSDAGRQAEARAVLDRALAASPDDVRAHELLGMVALRAGDPHTAEVHLRRALAIDDRLPSAWNTLGVALYQLRGPAEALAAWQRAVELDPGQYEALLNIGLVAREAGRRAEARQALQRFVATAPPDRFGPDIQKAQGLLRGMGG
jgi:arylsulfatase A-like enzyme/Tfp pilus assembly protein PilF